MTTKLTLTVEENVVKKAKLYAKHTGRSLSGLIENYLKTLTEEPVSKEHLSSKLKALSGVVKLPANFDADAELREYFENKHL